MWKHIEYDEDRDWEDLKGRNKIWSLTKVGFIIHPSLYCPALLIAGQSGGLLTSWRFDNVDLANARKAIAPGLPTFTKDGFVPTYRMVLRVSYGSPLFGELEAQVFEEETAPKAYETLRKGTLLNGYFQCSKNIGFKLLTTEIEMDYEAILFIVRSPSRWWSWINSSFKLLLMLTLISPYLTSKGW